MFQKNSFSIPSDNSGIFLVKVIQTRRCSSRKHAKICKFLRVVIKNTLSSLRRRRKRRSRAICVRTNHSVGTNRGRFYLFCDNALVVLKKRMNTAGKELYGPTSKFLRIRKFRIPYRYVF